MTVILRWPRSGPRRMIGRGRRPSRLASLAPQGDGESESLAAAVGVMTAERAKVVREDRMSKWRAPSAMIAAAAAIALGLLPGTAVAETRLTVIVFPGL